MTVKTFIMLHFCTFCFHNKKCTYIEYQFSILEWFLKDHHVTLKTEVIIRGYWGLFHFWPASSVTDSQPANMVFRCNFGWAPHVLFPIPKQPCLCARWLEFLHFRRRRIMASLHLCGRHFTEEWLHMAVQVQCW